MPDWVFYIADIIGVSLISGDVFVNKQSWKEKGERLRAIFEAHQLSIASPLTLLITFAVVADNVPTDLSNNGATATAASYALLFAGVAAGSALPWLTATICLRFNNRTSTTPFTSAEKVEWLLSGGSLILLVFTFPVLIAAIFVGQRGYEGASLVILGLMFGNLVDVLTLYAVALVRYAGNREQTFAGIGVLILLAPRVIELLRLFLPQLLDLLGVFALPI